MLPKISGESIRQIKLTIRAEAMKNQIELGINKRSMVSDGLMLIIKQPNLQS